MNIQQQNVSRDLIFKNSRVLIKIKSYSIYSNSEIYVIEETEVINKGFPGYV